MTPADRIDQSSLLNATDTAGLVTNLVKKRTVGDQVSQNGQKIAWVLPVVPLLLWLRAKTTLGDESG